jgi:hypothetical protein
LHIGDLNSATQTRTKMRTLVQLSVNAIADQCKKGIYDTCVGLLRVLPVHLVKEVYHCLHMSDSEIDACVHPEGYRWGFDHQDWRRLQRKASKEDPQRETFRSWPYDWFP